MLSKQVLRYVDRLLRDVCNTGVPFGGKTVLLGGDWRQLCPVVVNGSREDQVAESIKLDPLFTDNFEKLRFELFYCTLILFSISIIF